MNTSCLRNIFRMTPLAAGVSLIFSVSAAADSATPLRVATGAGSLAATSSPREGYSPWAQRYDMTLSEFQRKLPNAPPTPAGNTIVVQNCNDHGGGSLRAAATAAASGDTIDMTQLACTITLTTGAIGISQATLTLSGPGADKLTIDGGDTATPAHYNRVFSHTGSGSLGISGMTLTHAKYKGAASAFGGCVESQGTAVITDSVLTGCFAESAGNSYAGGGAVNAEKGVILLNSVVTGNFVIATSSTGATLGGGVRSFGNLTMKYSTVSDNSVSGSTTGARNKGGGVEVDNGDAYILASTISDNQATGYAGLRMKQSDGLHMLRLYNSTVSSNYASNYQGGIGGEANVVIANSTIAFNSHGQNRNGAGMRFVGGTQNIQSTIIAMNTTVQGIALSDADFGAAGSISGANNLITQSVGTAPAGTITACPLLGRLADNGGTTRTHRLLTNSPALDAGNNNTGASGSGFSNDQRGSGHARVLNGEADIGAFEYGGGTADQIFRSEFENRCN